MNSCAQGQKKGGALERLERFFRIQQLLEARLSVTGLELQEALEISRATLHRDIEYLRDRLGLPIVWDAELRAYRLDKDGEQNNRVHLPGIWLNEAEIAALTVLSEPLCRVDPAHPIGQAIQPLRDRLLDILERIGISIRDFAKRIRLVPHEIHGNPCANMPQIAHATLARRQLAIDYYSRSRGGRMTRLVSPQRLIYLRQNWYLDAWCHLRQGLRRFAFADIWGVELVEEAAYEVPEAELGEVCFSTHWGSPIEQRAVLRFSPSRARTAVNEYWHPQQTGEFTSLGEYVLYVPYATDQDLLSDILRHGSEVEVVSPEDLRNTVREAHLNAALRYPRRLPQSLPNGCFLLAQPTVFSPLAIVPQLAEYACFIPRVWP